MCALGLLDLLDLVALVCLPLFLDCFGVGDEALAPRPLFLGAGSSSTREESSEESSSTSLLAKAFGGGFAARALLAFSTSSSSLSDCCDSLLSFTVFVVFTTLCLVPFCLAFADLETLLGLGGGVATSEGGSLSSLAESSVLGFARGSNTGGGLGAGSADGDGL